MRRWIDDAVQTLSAMPYTCALDYVRDHGEGEVQHARDVGNALGISRQRVLVLTEQAQERGRAEARRMGIHDEESDG